MYRTEADPGLPAAGSATLCGTITNRLERSEGFSTRGASSSSVASRDARMSAIGVERENALQFLDLADRRDAAPDGW